MSLSDQVLKLSPAKLLALQDSLVDIGIALETGGDYRALIRKQFNSHPVGILHKIYQALLLVKKEDLDKIVQAIVIST